jgi:hypothetical protein
LNPDARSHFRFADRRNTADFMRCFGNNKILMRSIFWNIGHAARFPVTAIVLLNGQQLSFLASILIARTLHLLPSARDFWQSVIEIVPRPIDAKVFNVIEVKRLRVHEDNVLA